MSVLFTAPILAWCGTQRKKVTDTQAACAPLMGLLGDIIIDPLDRQAD